MLPHGLSLCNSGDQMSLLQKQPIPFKDAAGSITAFIVVLSFIAIGFVQGLGNAAFGATITMPESWSAAMLSLASAALGYLIGKNDQAPPMTPSDLTRAINSSNAGGTDKHPLPVSVGTGKEAPAQSEPAPTQASSPKPPLSPRATPP